MMKATFKLRGDSVEKIKKNFQEKSRFLIREMSNVAGRIVVREMKDIASRGLSPVRGQKRFVKYSESYRKAIRGGLVYAKHGKSDRPVNLKLSGGMWDSLSWKRIRGGVRIFFTSKLAVYHNSLGAGKTKVIRRILPKYGESLSRRITVKLREAFAILMK